MLTPAKKLVFQIIGDTEQFNKSISETTNRLEDFKKKTKESNELFAQVAKRAAIATTAIAAIGVAAAKMANDFNDGFAKVQTLIPGATERIKELQENVLDLSPAVGKTTDDLTDGLYQVISAFGDTADTTKNLELAAKAATAGNATTTDSINLLSAVTKGYGDTSNAAQKKVSDLAFTAVKLGQTDFPQLASSVQRVTAMSAELGVTQEEMFAVFSSGTGVIGGAAEVSTKLAAVYNEMQKPSKKLAEAFKQLGVVSGSQLIKKFGGLSGAMQALKGVAEKTGEPISNLFGSAEAGQLALYAAGKGAEKFTSDLVKMNTAIGSTDQAFDDATISGPNAFGFQLKQAGLNAKTFAIKIGQELIPSLQRFLTPLFNGLNALKNLDERTIKMIVSVGKVIITLTSVTAAVMSVKKGIDALRAAQIALNGAFKANLFGAFIVGVTTAIVALQQLAEWLDYVRNKKHQMDLDALKVESPAEKEAQDFMRLAKEYDNLLHKQELNNVEQNKLKTIKEQLVKLNPKFEEGLSLEKEGYEKSINALQKYNKEKQSELQSSIQETKQQKEDSFKKLKEIEEKIEELNNSPTIKVNVSDRDSQRMAQSEILRRRRERAQLTEALNQQKEFLAESEKTLERKKNLYAKMQDLSFSGLEPEKDANKEGTTTGGEKKSQKKRLKALDDEYNIERQIINNRNITTTSKNEELKKAEERFYKNRIKLLETFHLENLTEGKTFSQSQQEIVGKNNQSILEETQNTNTELERIADERYKKELDTLKNMAIETKKNIDAEIALKKELGEIEGKSENEKERNAKLLESQKLYEKRNELAQEYLRLQNSSNKKDEEKAKLLFDLIKALDKMADEAKKGAGTVSKTLEEKIKEAGNKVMQVVNSIKSAFDGVFDTAKMINDSKEEQRNRETATRLAEIERNKNETLLEIDDELAQMREEKQLADAEREAERREEEYQKRIADANRNILTLQGQFQTETNLERIKNKEKEIEEARKKKAEDIQRKKEEKEKEKREKEARKQEVELLNARAKAEYDFAVTKIETENIAGNASAKAAQEAAKWQKAQTAMSLTIKSIEQGVLAAIAIARGLGGDPLGFVEGAARTAAATMASVQIGLVAAQPLPPDYTAQPLPPAPRPIKFAHGGIVMPSSAGTGITLPNGAPGLVAEAGVPEMIMPITAPNLENLFKASGVTNNNTETSSIHYAPSYSVNVSQDMGEGLGEAIIKNLEEHDRALIELIENGKKNYYI